MSVYVCVDLSQGKCHISFFDNETETVRDSQSCVQSLTVGCVILMACLIPTISQCFLDFICPLEFLGCISNVLCNTDSVPAVGET